jgi:hypothetical protein
VPVQRRRRDAEALRHPFEIDYYDASIEFGSEDPADLSKTTRVLTIMLAEDWPGGLLRRFSRRIFQDHAQASSSDMGTTGKKSNPISTATPLNRHRRHLPLS